MLNDNYDHIENDVFYIAECIMGPADYSKDYELLCNDYNSELTDNCKCEEICTLPTCQCLQKSGGTNYIIQDELHILNINKESNYGIIECNDKCGCLENCGNRVVQKGPLEGLEITTCDEKSKGLGLYSTRFIKKGTFICEYAGELITKLQASRRHQINKLNGKMNYIFCLNEHSNKKSSQIFVDPSNFGNIGRYINHSCGPNSKVVPVRYQVPIPKLAIFSCIDILPGTEITFNYGSDTHQSGIKNRIKCLCNSINCIGFMPFDIY